MTAANRGLRGRVVAVTRAVLCRIIQMRFWRWSVRGFLRLLGPEGRRDLPASLDASGSFRADPPELKARYFEETEARELAENWGLLYAEVTFDGQRRMIERHHGPLAGLRILELGPGYSLAAGVLFYVHGASRYQGIDLFPIASMAKDPYARLRQHLARRPLLVPLESRAEDELRARALARFDEVVRLDGAQVVFESSKVDWKYPVDAARLPFEDGSFDVVLSNAAFEHFDDPSRAVRECARVLSPGGVGIHQIDFRDHRDFSKPLEFLQFSAAEWSARCTDGFCYTNRCRMADFERFFAEAGSTVELLDVNQRCEVGPDLRQRLHADFRDRPAADLEALSGLFVVRRSRADAPAPVTGGGA